MQIIDRRLITPVMGALLVVCALPQHLAAETVPPPRAYQWLDVNGELLPFQDHASILAALESAHVIHRQPTDRGVAGAEKLMLEFEGVRFHAAFRSVDRREVDTSSRSYGRKTRTYLKDSALFENAAYELSEILGIHRVPPVVVRKMHSKTGSLQIWMEATAPEIVLKEEGRLEPPDTGRWHRQKQIMVLLDNLIANRDRNQGNLLIDANWDLWFIDHTRAFGTSSRLPYQDRLVTCERDLWAHLRTVDASAIRQRLEPYLTSKEISRVLTRLKKIVRHIEKLIEKRGESSVLFDQKLVENHSSELP